MPVETSKDQICINQIIGQKTELIDVEGDVILNDIKPDVKSIISTNGIVSVYKKEITEGKVRLDGNINTYVIYLTGDNKEDVRSLNTTLDFTQFIEIENIKFGMSLDESVNIKNIECEIINSRKVNIKANLEVSVRVYSNESVEVINNIEDIFDIQVLNSEMGISSSVGEGSTKVHAKDTISISVSDDLAEILKTKIKLVDKEIKISYNKVLVKADCDMTIMYLTEDNRISTINSKLPIMGFIDIPNISDDNICDVKYKLKNFIVKANNIEKHSIYVEAEFEVICFVYETKYINVIEDIYSTSSNLEYTKKQIKTISNKVKIKELYNITERLLVPEIEENRLYDVAVRPDITNIKPQKGKIVFEGEIFLQFLFEFNDVMNTKNMAIPFNFEVMREEIDEFMNIEPSISVSKETFVVLGNGNIETEISLELELNMQTERMIDEIEEINAGERKPDDIYSMVIYFVKPGDTLWKIAKKLRSTIEDIQRINEIDDTRKIFEGQQLYIPKYQVRNVSI